jgi:hypothetical protein
MQEVDDRATLLDGAMQVRPTQGPGPKTAGQARLLPVPQCPGRAVQERRHGLDGQALFVPGVNQIDRVGTHLAFALALVLLADRITGCAARLRRSRLQGLPQALVMNLFVGTG